MRVFLSLILGFNLLFADDFSAIKKIDYKKLDWSQAYSGSVTVDRPISEVWAYVSDSTKAREWSVYFHHIGLISDPKTDGQVGATRRCYRNENEKGVFWDEDILAVEPEKQRILLSYNFNGFRSETKTYSSFVMQEYIRLNEHQTKLVFKTMGTEAMTFLDKIIFYFARTQVEEIFKKNLENIKNHIEGKSSTYMHTTNAYNFFEK